MNPNPTSTAIHLDTLPDVLTPVEVARVLRLGRNTVYECLRTGTIPSIKIGRKLLIPKDELRRLLAGQVKPA
jgi:excisionase family DNA binding protein